MCVCVPGSRHLRIDVYIRVLGDTHTRVCVCVCACVVCIRLISVEKSPGINCRDSNNNCGFVIGLVIIIELNWKARTRACVCIARIRKQKNARIGRCGGSGSGNGDGDGGGGGGGKTNCVHMAERVHWLAGREFQNQKRFSEYIYIL